MKPLRFFGLFAFLSLSCSVRAATHTETLTYAPGKTIALTLPNGFGISLAAKGIRRARFFAQAPDGRIFLTSLYSLADNNRGAIYILDDWNQKQRSFTKVTPYLTHLHNPNSIAFYTDERGRSWIYVALTDKLVRFAYHAGDMKPSSAEELLIRFPDYGLNYKYGGWHLTRTVTVAKLHGKTRLYVATGSSCNYCREHEAQRASVMSVDPDGAHPELIATGLRNAVDMRFVPELDGGALFATNMGDDHLEDNLPEDTFFELDSNAHTGPDTGKSVPNYGWPKCYFSRGRAVYDGTPLPDGPRAADAAHVSSSTIEDSVYGKQRGVAKAGTNLPAQVHATAGLPDLGPAPEPLKSCEKVPAAYDTFAAHASPLGLVYFARPESGLSGSFLVALHGSGHLRVGTGYRIVQIAADSRKQTDFMTGFLIHEAGKAKVKGRPCGLLAISPDTFLISDDYLGIVYAVYRR